MQHPPSKGTTDVTKPPNLPTLRGGRKLREERETTQSLLEMLPGITPSWKKDLGIVYPIGYSVRIVGIQSHPLPNSSSFPGRNPQEGSELRELGTITRAFVSVPVPSRDKPIFSRISKLLVMWDWEMQYKYTVSWWQKWECCYKTN